MSESNQQPADDHGEETEAVEHDVGQIKQVVEGALLATAEALSLNQLNGLFEPDNQPGHGLLRQALAALDADCEQRAVELTEVASGYRLQVRQSVMPWIGRLWSEKPQRYSRALLETLAIIAYRQPITRGEIEQIRGVSISSSILRTLQEREWIRTVGHRDVPGRPELLGTTKAFLDYFNLKSLDELPTLAEIKDLENLEPELELSEPPANDPPETENRHEQEGTEQPKEENDREENDEEVTTDPDDQARPHQPARPETAAGQDGEDEAQGPDDEDGPEAGENRDKPGG